MVDVDNRLGLGICLGFCFLVGMLQIWFWVRAADELGWGSQIDRSEWCFLLSSLICPNQR